MSKEKLETREKRCVDTDCPILSINNQNTRRVAELEEKVANLEYLLEGRDNEIDELEAQIEKMKCCGNCAKYNSGYGENSCKITASGICGEWETSIGKF